MENFPSSNNSMDKGHALVAPRRRNGPAIRRHVGAFFEEQTMKSTKKMSPTVVASRCRPAAVRKSASAESLENVISPNTTNHGLIKEQNDQELAILGFPFSSVHTKKGCAGQMSNLSMSTLTFDFDELSDDGSDYFSGMILRNEAKAMRRSYAGRRSFIEKTSLVAEERNNECAKSKLPPSIPQRRSTISIDHDNFMSFRSMYDIFMNSFDESVLIAADDNDKGVKDCLENSLRDDECGKVSGLTTRVERTTQLIA